MSSSANPRRFHLAERAVQEEEEENENEDQAELASAGRYEPEQTEAGSKLFNLFGVRLHEASLRIVLAGELRDCKYSS